MNYHPRIDLSLSGTMPIIVVVVVVVIIIIIISSLAPYGA